jgi:hypothetical protein
VILVGDFHPFPQAQKAFLRFAQDLVPDHSLIFGLECFAFSQQATLDQFLAGHITLGELREDVEFDRYWPFAWSAYGEILAFARREKVPVLALNPDGISDLAERDDAAAGRIFEAMQADPHSKIMVLYGELHLAPSHLPERLRSWAGPRLATLTVHQTVPEIYWRAPRTSAGTKPEVVRLGRGEYCILNSVPWVKLRSFLDWLEGNPIDPDWEGESDLAGMVHDRAEHLVKILGLPTLPPVKLAVYGPDSPPPIGNKGKKRTRMESAFFTQARRFQRTCYLGSRSLLYIPVKTTNSVSEAAAYLLWDSLRPHSAKSPPRGSSSLTAHFAIGYLGSKLLNPKRKCNEVRDLTWGLKTGTKGKRQVLVLALHLLRPYLNDIPRVARAGALPLAASLEAHRLAGYIMADRLYSALLKRPELLSFVRGIFRTSVSSPAWAENLLQAMAKNISKARTRVISKHELF